MIMLIIRSIMICCVDYVIIIITIITDIVIPFCPIYYVLGLLVLTGTSTHTEDLLGQEDCQAWLAIRKILHYYCSCSLFGKY